MAILKHKCSDCEESYPLETQTCPIDGRALKPVLVGSLVGTILADRYEILQEIGKGGMGVIYKARDLNAESDASNMVAVKLLLNNAQENEVLRSRFSVEARAASSLNHPNIVKMYEYSFTPEGLPFMIMQWLPGSTLDAMITDGQIDIERAIQFIIQMCEALSHAHRHDIIHRDIKPGNIMIVTEDATEKAVLVDFGIAKIFAQPGKTSMHLTKTGQIFGSPLYMSPEQCMGQKLDARSDIYSLGCVLYECITGSTPFAADNVLGVIYQHINDQPAAFASSRKEKALESLVYKAMAKKPEERFQSMNDFSVELQKYFASIVKSGAYKPEPMEEKPASPDAYRQFEYYKEAAERGVADAQLEVALMYLEGVHVEQSNDLAFEWCLKAASQGQFGGNVSTWRNV